MVDYTFFYPELCGNSCNLPVPRPRLPISVLFLTNMATDNKKAQIEVFHFTKIIPIRQKLLIPAGNLSGFMSHFNISNIPLLIAGMVVRRFGQGLTGRKNEI
jgi:hypothetical protein